MVGNVILEQIEKIEEQLRYIQSVDNQDLLIRTRDCPHCIPMPTKLIGNKVYEIIKNAYEEELKNLENRLANL
jgi:hypothetical protein